MNIQNKQRLVGIIVLVAFVVLLVPFLFTGSMKKNPSENPDVTNFQPANTSMIKIPAAEQSQGQVNPTPVSSSAPQTAATVAPVAAANQTTVTNVSMQQAQVPTQSSSSTQVVPPNSAPEQNGQSTAMQGGAPAAQIEPTAEDQDFPSSGPEIASNDQGNEEEPAPITNNQPNQPATSVAAPSTTAVTPAPQALAPTTQPKSTALPVTSPINSSPVVKSAATQQPITSKPVANTVATPLGQAQPVPKVIPVVKSMPKSKSVLVKKTVKSIKPKTKPTKVAAKAKVKATAVKPKNVSSDGKYVWSVQIGSFEDQQRVKKVIKQLHESGYKVFVQQVTVANGKVFTRILVGRQNSRDEAAQIAGSLQRTMKISGSIVRNQQ